MKVDTSATATTTVSVSPNNILDETTREHDDRRDDNDYLFDDDDQDLNNGDCTISNKKHTYRGYEELQVVNEFPFIVPSASSSSSSSLKITKSSSTTKEYSSLDVLPIAGFHTPTSTGGNINNNTNETDEITFLIEVVKATIPKSKRKGWVNLPRNVNKDFGMHCTATWVGPVNPSGRRRREWPLHRTMTLGINETDVGGSASAYAAASNNNSDSTPPVIKSSSSDSGLFHGEGQDDDDDTDQDEVECTEHVFTVNDASLFLFRTSMRQLVNAASSDTKWMSDDVQHADPTSGGLRFDIFERPLDVLNSAYSTILAENMAELETNALTDEEIKLASPSITTSLSLFNSTYRLVGSVFLTPYDILSRCDEQRFECDMLENWRKIQRQAKRGSGGGGGGTASSSSTAQMLPKRVDGARLALRIRVASEFDIVFMRSIEEMYDSVDNTKGVNLTLRAALMKARNTRNLEPASIVTELDESLLTAENSMKAIGNFVPMMIEPIRYMMSNDIDTRELVKPYPDPARPEETFWMTEKELRQECYMPSTNWIQAGRDHSDSLGQVYVEVLKCAGLPNTDGPGNKSDPFVSIVYGNVMVQTEVINDCLSPMWMPWSSRAFKFQISHPSTAVHIGVADFDLGPLDHECIGRVSICLNRFNPGTLYTLSYNLYDSPNLVERGEIMGKITLRLRVEISDYKMYLLEGNKAPEQRFINSQQKKTLKIAKYCVDGPHDEENFEMNLFRSHINELLTQKRYLMYAITDGLKSLIYWRGQVRIGGVWVPLYSAVVFFYMTHVVENPHLIPSSILFGCGWILVANMTQRTNHPSPWHRGHSFAYYMHILIHGKPHAAEKGVRIKSNQGQEEHSKLEEVWKQRLADEDADYAKQVDLDAKIKTITDGANVRTRTKAKLAIVDPISALAGARLLPYQQRLAGYCNRLRYIRNVLTWNESIVSFFLTLVFFGAGFVSLFIPWRFLLLWTSRLTVWIFLGPWMRLLDMIGLHEETVHQKSKMKKKMREAFHHQHKMAKMLCENALKMKAFRVKLFGKYITTIPGFNLTRHEDVPLPESTAEPYHSEEGVQTVKFIPSQDLSDAMMPITDDTVQCKLMKQQEKYRLLSNYEKRVNDRELFDSSAAVSDDLVEGYELIGTNDQLVCLHSTKEEKDSSHMKNKSDLVKTTDKSIQLKTSDKAKYKWTFTASIQLMLKKEPVEECSTPDAPLFCGDTAATLLCEDTAGALLCEDTADALLCEDTAAIHNEMIEEMDDLSQEGVEIVPVLGSNDNDDDDDGKCVTDLKPTSTIIERNDNVSMFYLNQDITYVSTPPGSFHDN